MSLPEINTKPQVTVREYTDENGNSITEKTTVEDNKKQTVIITEKIIKEMTGGVHVVQAHKEKLSSLNGNAQTAPTDNGLSSANKTPEQEANLAKLANAKTYLTTLDGQNLASYLLEGNDLSRKEKKALKKAGIDPDAFMQALNEKNSKARYNANVAAEKKDDMGALANAYLGEDTEELPQNRQSVRKDGVRNEEERSFFKKIFTQKEKQNVKDDKKYAENGGTKVNIHSSQETKRAAEFAHDISDDAAKAGNEYLDAFVDGYKGKKREKFKEIDENGNITKVKVVYNKDGSVKKVVTKNDDTGKLVVKEAKDGHITIKGNLQSDNIMKDAQTKSVSEIKVTKETHTQVIEKCDEKAPEPDPVPPPPKPDPVPPPPPTPPVPPTPPKPVKEPIQGGLVQDFVNPANSNGIGSVQGETIRTEFKNHGAKAMVKAYCSYTNETAPKVIKSITRNGNYAWKANNYNAEHIAQSLINDPSGKINEKALAAFITELQKQGNKAALQGVKTAISRHNKKVKELSPDKRNFDETTGTLNKFVTGREIAIQWLMKQQF